MALMVNDSNARRKSGNVSETVCKMVTFLLQITDVKNVFMFLLKF